MDEMPGNLVPIAHAGVPADPRTPAERIYAAWLGARSENTRRAYEGDVGYFAASIRADSATAAVQGLLALSAGQANSVVLDWRNAMVAAGLAPATVNRRLAALRSIVKLGRSLGAVVWALEVANVKAEAYRDTRGPGRRAFASCWPPSSATHRRPSGAAPSWPCWSERGSLRGLTAAARRPCAPARCRTPRTLGYPEPRPGIVPLAIGNV